jgi:hypothetical protein
MSNYTEESEIALMSMQDVLNSFRHMNKKDLEINFDLNVARLEVHKENDNNAAIICDILDAIAHELYTRIGHKLH